MSSTYALIQQTFEVPEHATRHLYVFASRRSETGYRGTPVTGIRDKLEEPHIDELMDRLMNRLARHAQATCEFGWTRSITIERREQRRVREADPRISRCGEAIEKSYLEPSEGVEQQSRQRREAWALAASDTSPVVSVWRDSSSCLTGRGKPCSGVGTVRRSEVGGNEAPGSLRSAALTRARSGESVSVAA